jgi:hypothetical protein
MALPVLQDQLVEELELPELPELLDPPDLADLLAQQDPLALEL